MSSQCHNVRVVSAHFGKTTEALSPNAASPPLHPLPLQTMSPRQPLKPSHLLTPPSTVLTCWLPEHWRHTQGPQSARLCLSDEGSSPLASSQWVEQRDPGNGRRQWRWCHGWRVRGASSPSAWARFLQTQSINVWFESGFVQKVSGSTISNRQQSSFIALTYLYEVNVSWRICWSSLCLRGEMKADSPADTIYLLKIHSL